MRTLCRLAMALPLTWRAGAANPFAPRGNLRSILVRYADHDLCGRAQGGLERAQADGAERAGRSSTTPEIHDPAARIERSRQRSALGAALRCGEIERGERALRDALEHAADLE